MTLSAGAPLANAPALRHPSTRLFPKSETNRGCGVELRSVTTAIGLKSDLASTTLGFELLKFSEGCPTTRDGTSLRTGWAGAYPTSAAPTRKVLRTVLFIGLYRLRPRDGVYSHDTMPFRGGANAPK